MRKPSFNYDLVVNLYNQNLKIATIAELMHVVPDTIERVLRVKGIERNRLNNPAKHSQSLSAIKSRLHRYQEELDEALESGDKHAIREASQKVMREKQVLAGLRAETQRRDDAEDV